MGAYCDMQTGATCIQPKPAVSHEITIMSDDKEAWVGELDTNAFDINYKADSNQMNFLQLSSSSAEQGKQQEARGELDGLERPGDPSPREGQVFRPLGRVPAQEEVLGADGVQGAVTKTISTAHCRRPSSRPWPQQPSIQD